MKILVVGMGLIGGSICKSIKATTTHTVDGCDVQPEVLEQALQDGAIDGTGRMEDCTSALPSRWYRMRCPTCRPAPFW